jgi:hypothetical protein
MSLPPPAPSTVSKRPGSSPARDAVENEQSTPVKPHSSDREKDAEGRPIVLAEFMGQLELKMAAMMEKYIAANYGSNKQSREHKQAPSMLAQLSQAVGAHGAAPSAAAAAAAAAAPGRAPVRRLHQRLP